MRKIREITDEEENFRLEDVPPFKVIRRDPVEPEPVGTLIIVPMRIVGYDPDCDGSLMARLETLSFDDLEGEIDPEIRYASKQDAVSYGIHVNQGLYPSSGIVATAEELHALFEELSDGKA